MKLSEAQIKIVKLETQLALTKTPSILSRPETPPPLLLPGKMEKRNVETQTETAHRVDISSQTESKVFKNKVGSSISDSLHGAIQIINLLREFKLKQMFKRDQYSNPKLNRKLRC